jgi:hypothetical protein
MKPPRKKKNEETK